MVVPALTPNDAFLSGLCITSSRSSPGFSRLQVVFCRLCYSWLYATDSPVPFVLAVFCRCACPPLTSRFSPASRFHPLRSPVVSSLVMRHPPPFSRALAYHVPLPPPADVVEDMRLSPGLRGRRAGLHSRWDEGRTNYGSAGDAGR
jgi:hypothetical protein